MVENRRCREADPRPAEQPSGPADPVVLRLTLDPGERISGVAERIGGTGRHQFSGWVDLMSVLEALSGSPGGKEQRDVLAIQPPVVTAGRGHADVRER